MTLQVCITAKGIANIKYLAHSELSGEYLTKINTGNKRCFCLLDMNNGKWQMALSPKSTSLTFDTGLMTFYSDVIRV